jgi:hypothetical protein
MSAQSLPVSNQRVLLLRHRRSLLLQHPLHHRDQRVSSGRQVYLRMLLRQQLTKL